MIYGPMSEGPYPALHLENNETVKFQTRCWRCGTGLCGRTKTYCTGRSHTQIVFVAECPVCHPNMGDLSMEPFHPPDLEVSSTTVKQWTSTGHVEEHNAI